MNRSPAPSPVERAPTPNRYTVVAIALNLVLLSMIVYGYYQSEELRWAWVLVGIPILIVTIQYVRHLFRN